MADLKQPDHKQNPRTTVKSRSIHVTNTRYMKTLKKCRKRNKIIWRYIESDRERGREGERERESESESEREREREGEGERVGGGRWVR